MHWRETWANYRPNPRRRQKSKDHSLFLEYWSCVRLLSPNGLWHVQGWDGCTVAPTDPGARAGIEFTILRGLRRLRSRDAFGNFNRFGLLLRTLEKISLDLAIRASLSGIALAPREYKWFVDG